MAGRLYIPPYPADLPPDELFGSLATPALERQLRSELLVSANRAPRMPVSMLRLEGPRLRLVPALWGLTPSWLEIMDHAPHVARAESLETRRMFRESFISQRALIPVGGVYVWKEQPRMKQPFLVTHPTRAPLLLAALWTRHFSAPLMEGLPPEGRDSFALISVECAGVTSRLTDRMPAVIAPHQVRDWLNAETPLETVRSMLTPNASLAAFPVARLVNDPEHQEWSVAHPTGPMLT
ncbi:SOS response-associated peptidase [Cobetia amphilecti]|uniref:SOS response-associated peptidase n=2 Tax=Cobetia TaxID=204286 RepID=UPI0025502E02|nr:SOS response-associated peptidase family protein [Cobetia amphilecti]